MIESDLGQEVEQNLEAEAVGFVKAACLQVSEVASALREQGVAKVRAFDQAESYLRVETILRDLVGADGLTEIAPEIRQNHAALIGTYEPSLLSSEKPEIVVSVINIRSRNDKWLDHIESGELARA